MMPNLSRFQIVIWLLVMCPSRGVKWQSFRWCSRQQFSYKFHNRWQLRTVKQNLDSSTCSAPVTSVFAPDQSYFRSAKQKMAFATSHNVQLGTPESTGVKIQNLVARQLNHSASRKHLPFVATSLRRDERSSTIRESRFSAAILRCEMYYGDLE